jgi:endonuclease/exonuclease/phosphatase family metal-dependent hydrolase
VKRIFLTAVCLAVLPACVPVVNYGESGPRYAGAVEPAPRSPGACAPATIRVVTFNVQYANHVDRAADLLSSTAELRAADVIALQEMDAAGTRALATALGMSYVYYPATLYQRRGRDFGNAILSRWPIVDDRKISLPHRSRFNATRRAAVRATIDVAGIALQVYSVHLATQIEIGPGKRRDQTRAVVADANGHARVVVAGDMNSHGIGALFEAHGFAWPTREQATTTALFNWDHIFLRGVALVDPDSTGVVRNDHRASDHRPVWAALALGASCAEPD